ncbi:MAG: hypothetical protein ABL998_13745, partial [Planctomycetota bacterium]
MAEERALDGVLARRGEAARVGEDRQELQQVDEEAQGAGRLQGGGGVRGADQHGFGGGRQREAGPARERGRVEIERGGEAWQREEAEQAREQGREEREHLRALARLWIGLACRHDGAEAAAGEPNGDQARAARLFADGEQRAAHEEARDLPVQEQEREARDSDARQRGAVAL